MKIDKNGKLLILGAYGRIGISLVEQLDQFGYTNLLVPTSKSCDLLDNYSCESYFRNYKPDYVINLSAKKTTIALCNEYPASICRDTLQMNINVLELCRKYDVKKLVNIICSCSYPHQLEILAESEFWNGSPHPSIISHGESKRLVYYLGQSYHKQYNMNVITLALNNIFGNANWNTLSSLKFMDSLIWKITDAKVNKLNKIYLWGTGQPRREVLYNKDAAEGIFRAFESYDDSELLNIGTGMDYTIEEWAKLIANVVGWKGKFDFQTNKPDGQMKKLFDVNKMYTILNWGPPTPINKSIIEVHNNAKTYILGSKI